MVSIKIIPILLLTSLGARAQTFGEWFNQKSTQKKYLTQQIAALNAFRSELSAGYQVAKHGLGNIGSFNTSEHDLHSDYYTSLKTVSQTVKNNNQVKEILGFQQDINTKLKSLADQQYYNQVKAALLKDCDQQLSELQQVLSGSTMSDAERLGRISAIHQAMLSNYRFAIRFTYQVGLLENDKTKQDYQTLKKLYGTL